MLPPEPLVLAAIAQLVNTSAIADRYITNRFVITGSPPAVTEIAEKTIRQVGVKCSADDHEIAFTLVTIFHKRVLLPSDGLRAAFEPALREAVPTDCDLQRGLLVVFNANQAARRAWNPERPEESAGHVHTG